MLTDMDLQRMKPMENPQNGEVVLRDPTTGSIIDELAYKTMSAYLCKLLAPIFRLIGVPIEVCELTLIRPFSSNAGYVLLRDIFARFGVDSYVGKCASVIMGSSDTIFYVSSIYFSCTKVKKTGLAIPIALVCNVACCILSCFCCRFI